MNHFKAGVKALTGEDMTAGLDNSFCSFIAPRKKLNLNVSFRVTGGCMFKLCLCLLCGPGDYKKIK